MRNSTFISIQFQSLQLWNCHSQRLCYSTDARLKFPSLSSLHAGELIEEVSAKRITLAAHISLTVADQLGNEMEITHLRQKLGDLTKVSVRIHLLEVSLCQALRILLIRHVGTGEDLLGSFPHFFFSDHRPAGIVLIEFETIPPCVVRDLEMNIEHYVGVLPSVQ